MTCPARIAETLKHFVSKRAMNVEGLGDKWIEQFLEKKLISRFSDIYDLTVGDLSKLDRQGRRSSEKLIEAIARSKNTTLDRFIYGLGVRLVGGRTAELLALHFGTLERFTDATEEQLYHVEGVGPSVALSIKDFLSDEKNRSEIERLLEKGIRIQSVGRVADSSPQLKGKTFVITGTLPTLSRERAEDLIRQCGGKVMNQVSRNTDFLLLGESPGSKLQRAIELGVKQIGEQELKTMLEARSEKQS